MIPPSLIFLLVLSCLPLPIFAFHLSLLSKVWRLNLLPSFPKFFSTTELEKADLPNVGMYMQNEAQILKTSHILHDFFALVFWPWRSCHLFTLSWLCKASIESFSISWLRWCSPQLKLSQTQGNHKHCLHPNRDHKISRCVPPATPAHNYNKQPTLSCKQHAKHRIPTPTCCKWHSKRKVPAPKCCGLRAKGKVPALKCFA